MPRIEVRSPFGSGAPSSTPLARTLAALATLAPAVAIASTNLVAEPPAVGRATRVTIELVLGGELRPEAPPTPMIALAADPAVTDTSLAAGDAPLRPDGTRPLRALGSVAYEERVLAAGLGVLRTARMVESARAEVHVGGGVERSSLRDDRRLLVAEGPGLVWAASGPLTRAELDVVASAGDPLAADRQLPVEPVDVGQSWQVDAGAIAPLVGIESPRLCEVTALATEIEPTYARIRFAGAVHGLTDGAERRLDLRGVALFDRRAERVTRVNLAWAEDRATGPATPGIDATVKANFTIKPLDAPDALGDGVIARIERLGANPPAGAFEIELEGPAGAWAARHDRSWHLVRDGRDTVSLRRVVGDHACGETTITTLPPARSPRTPDPAALQADVRKALGPSLRAIDSSRSWRTAEGLEATGLASSGVLRGVPVQWRHYLVASPSGASISVATIVEADLAPELDDEDLRIIDTLRVRGAMETAARPASPR